MPPRPCAAVPRELLEALRKPSRSQLVVAVLLGLLGFALVTQVR